MVHALRYPLEQTTVRRTALTLLNLNQTKGFDCPGCGWPEPDPAHRQLNEYCENGAKRVNDEATSRRITAGFFRQHPVSGLARRFAQWINQQGRLTAHGRAARLGPLRANRLGGGVRAAGRGAGPAGLPQ